MLKLVQETKSGIKKLEEIELRVPCEDDMPEPYTVVLSRCSIIDNGSKCEREYKALGFEEIDTALNLITKYSDDELIEKSNYILDEDAYTEDRFRFPLLPKDSTDCKIESIKDEYGNIVCSVLTRPGAVETVMYAYDTKDRLVNENRICSSNHSECTYYNYNALRKERVYYDDENVVKQCISSENCRPVVSMIQYDDNFKHKMYSYSFYENKPEDILDMSTYRYEDDDNTEITIKVYHNYSDLL